MTNEHAGYSLATFEQAGWTLHTVAPVIKSQTVDNRDGGHAGTFTRPTLSYRPTVEHRRDLVETVRRALPGIGAVDGLRAVRTLVALRGNPADTQARADALALESDGTMPKMPAAPDPWSARQHETTVKRTRKGRTVQERTRVGIAPVIGSTLPVWNGHADGLSDGAGLARRMATLELESAHVRADNGATVYGARVLRSGARVGLDVQRVADRHYRSHGLPALIGTDVTSWEEVRSVPNGVDPALLRYVTVTRSYADDVVAVSGAASISGERAEYTAHTRHNYHRVTRPTRVTLPKGRARQGDPCDRPNPGILRGLGFDPSGAPIFATAIRWELIAPSHDVERRFVGLRAVARPTTRDRHGVRRSAERVKRSTVKRERDQARTIGTVREPATVEAWATLLDTLDKGEAIDVATPDGTVRVTRGKGRNARLSSSGARGKYRTRTAESMAHRLASA